MKKLFFLISVFTIMLFVAGCEKPNPLWGLWMQTPKFGPKTEIMFLDDNTGFVFVADTAKYETTWKQDSLLQVRYFDASSSQKSLGELKCYKVSIDGNNMKLEEVKTGKVTNYSRYIE